MKIIDLHLTIDGLILKEQSVEDYIQTIEEITSTSYPILYEIIYEEEIKE